MKVLILSCNTGEGHNSAARALMERLHEKGVECEIRDTLSFDSELKSRLISGVHIKSAIYAPKLFVIGNIIAASAKNTPFHSISYADNARYAFRLCRYIRENGFDTAIATHVFPAEALTVAKKILSTGLKAYFVSTDYACPPFLCETKLDGYFIPHTSLVNDFRQNRIPTDRQFAFGIPTERKFSYKTDRALAREQLALSLKGRLYLIMTGSMGFGDVSGLMCELLAMIEPDDNIAVLGGNNESLKRSLRDSFRDSSNVAVFDFTRSADIFMDAADVVFTKPGGLSSTEIAAKRIPLVHTAAIPGWETQNAEFFQKLGMSVHTGDIRESARMAAELATNTGAADAMKECQRQNIFPDAARRIVDFVISGGGSISPPQIEKAK